MIPGNLEMYPTQAKKRLEWATNHFHSLPIFILLVGRRPVYRSGGNCVASASVRCGGGAIAMPVLTQTLVAREVVYSKGILFGAGRGCRGTYGFGPGPVAI
jgi:hypothetical protein